MSHEVHQLGTKEFNRLKEQQVSQGHKVLGRAASNKDLLGHGTGDFRYERICEEGAMTHRKETFTGVGNYVPLSNFVRGGEAPWDQGNGLFVLDPAKERSLKDPLFIPQRDGSRKVLLSNMKWIVLPPCEAEIARGPKYNTTAVARYRDIIVTYEEAAHQLGFIEGLNRITNETRRCVNAFRSQIGDQLLGRERISQAIVIAQAIVREAAADGANGVIKAGMALQILAQALPDNRLAVRYRKDIRQYQQLKRIIASDNTWYAVVQMMDDLSDQYALVLSDERNVNRQISLRGSRVSSDEDGYQVFE